MTATSCPTESLGSAAGATTAETPGTPARRRRGAFWLVGLTLVAFLAASSAPSPLYVVFQERWGFSALTLTTVFASYAIALLVALVTVGGISDFLGRRPVLLAALALEAVSMVVFLVAHDVPLLVLARVVQGLATGAATGVASAALVDLQPAGTQLGGVVNGAAATGGLALGALASGLLVQYAAHATTLVFVVLLAAFVVLAVPLYFLPETVSRRPGALRSLAPRLAVPPQARATFVAVLPIVVATWSMGALYLSLGPSIAAGVLGLTSHLAGALVVTVFTGSGAVAAVAARNRPARPVMLAGAAVLAAGTTLAVLGVHTGDASVFFLGTPGRRHRLRHRVPRRLPLAGRARRPRAARGAAGLGLRGQLPRVQPARDRGRAAGAAAGAPADRDRVRRRGGRARAGGAARRRGRPAGPPGTRVMRP